MTAVFVLSKFTHVMRRTIYYVLGTLAVLAAIVALSRWNGTSAQPATSASAATVLTVTPANYDFGSVSMAAGPVRRQFTVSNGGSSPVTMTKLSTSCMCTKASLLVGGRQVGPFGMPGHGAIPRIQEVLPAGGSATLEVTFDPAAHGPAGVGRVDRQVTLETNSGAPLKVAIAATVTP